MKPIVEDFEVEMNKAFATPMPPAIDDAWADLATLETTRDAVNLIEQATIDERVRCGKIINEEIAKGDTVGIPRTSGVMTLLLRIAAAIGNG